MRKFTDLYLGRFKVITAQISLKLLFRNGENLFHTRFVGYVLDFNQKTIGNHWLPIIAYLQCWGSYFSKVIYYSYKLHVE